MSTIKKLTIAVIALSLALICTVGATLAYLVATSNVVTNTFTYGNITIQLEETKGTLNAQDNTREFKNVIPGDVVEKDPVIVVTEGSEQCYVYVLITNELGSAVTYNISVGTGAEQWTKVVDDATSVLYRYNSVVNAKDQDVKLPVFTTLSFAATLSADGLTALAGKNVVIQAYAHQAENLGDTPVSVADNAAKSWRTTTLNSNT